MASFFWASCCTIKFCPGKPRKKCSSEIGIPRLIITSSENLEVHVSKLVCLWWGFYCIPCSCPPNSCMLGYVSLCRYYARPAITIQKAQNLTIAFRFITDIEKIPLVNIGEPVMFIAYSRRNESYEFVFDTQNYCKRYTHITCYTLRMLCYLPGNTMYNQILHLAALTHLVWLVELDIRNLMCTPERSVHLHYAHREVATSTHLYSMLLIYWHYFLLLFCLNNPPMDLNLEVSSSLGWIVFSLPHCGLPMRK